mmetsp:Transcript_14715/g.22881  ORF Transcript_14715/g.22881 Transcript_14715/m.22881 type:complete len:204 (+) Transcript_14715:674-1285(+)
MILQALVPGDPIQLFPKVPPLATLQKHSCQCHGQWLALPFFVVGDLEIDLVIIFVEGHFFLEIFWANKGVSDVTKLFLRNDIILWRFGGGSFLLFFLLLFVTLGCLGLLVLLCFLLELVLAPPNDSMEDLKLVALQIFALEKFFEVGFTQVLHAVVLENLLRQNPFCCYVQFKLEVFAQLNINVNCCFPHSTSPPRELALDEQ